MVTAVFLHPVGLDGECWQFLESPRLANAVRYNLLWHGGRPEPSEPLTMESMADDVVANVDGDLDVIGLSMGGAVAQYVALRHPDRVRSLMVCASAYGRPGVSKEHVDRAEAVLEQGMAETVAPMIARWFTKDAIDATDHPGVTYTRERLLADSPRQFAAGWLALSDFHTKELLATIAVPTTVLHPEQDLGPLAAKEEMVSLLPNARLSVVAGPHMVHLERPAAFEAAVLEHLDWVEQSAS